MKEVIRPFTGINNKGEYIRVDKDGAWKQLDIHDGELAFLSTDIVKAAQRSSSTATVRGLKGFQAQ